MNVMSNHNLGDELLQISDRGDLQPTLNQGIGTTKAIEDPTFVGSLDPQFKNIQRAIELDSRSFVAAVSSDLQD